MIKLRKKKLHDDSGEYGGAGSGEGGVGGGGTRGKYRSFDQDSGRN